MTFAKPVIHLDQLRAWKESVLEKLGTGIANLAGRRNVQVITGRAAFDGPKTLRVETPEGPRQIQFPEAIIAAHSNARFLRLFDLEEITRSHFIPLVFRHRVESMIVERIPTMPLGNKKTLAKKAAGNVLLKMLQDRDAEVVQLCLNNPNMVEGHLFKVINRDDTNADTIMMIATHPNWSNRSLIRFSLVRNAATPLTLSVPFIKSMKLMDLYELHADPLLPVSVRPFVHRELFNRGKDPEQGRTEEVFEIDEEEMEESTAEAMRHELSERDEEGPMHDEGGK